MLPIISYCPGQLCAHNYIKLSRVTIELQTAGVTPLFCLHIGTTKLGIWLSDYLTARDSYPI